MAEATSGIGSFLGGNAETPQREQRNDTLIYAGVAALVLVLLLLARR